MSSDHEAQELIMQAGRVIGQVQARVKALEAALIAARGNIDLIAEGLSPHAYRMAYSSSTPIKFVTLVANAKNSITEALGK